MRLDPSIRSASILQNQRQHAVPKMGSSSLATRSSQWISLTRTLLVTGFCLSLVVSVEAKIYKYRSPDGRLILSNSPPPAGSEVTGTSREGSGPSTLTTAPTAIKPAPTQPQHRDRKSSNFYAQPTTRKRRKSESTSKTSRPVNTHKFGLLEIGSSKVAVERRIGPPEKRVRHGKKKRVILRHGQYISRNVQIESWHYPGNSRILSTRLVFYDDQLAEKDKAR